MRFARQRGAPPPIAPRSGIRSPASPWPVANVSARKVADDGRDWRRYLDECGSRLRGCRRRMRRCHGSGWRLRGRCGSAVARCSRPASNSGGAMTAATPSPASGQTSAQASPGRIRNEGSRALSPGTRSTAAGDRASAFAQMLGGASSGEAEALFGRTMLQGLAASDDGEDLGRRRLDLEIGYGFAVARIAGRPSPISGYGWRRGFFRCRTKTSGAALSLGTGRTASHSRSDRRRLRPGSPDSVPTVPESRQNGSES